MVHFRGDCDTFIDSCQWHACVHKVTYVVYMYILAFNLWIMTAHHCFLRNLAATVGVTAMTSATTTAVVTRVMIVTGIGTVVVTDTAAHPGMGKLRIILSETVL